MAFRPRFVVALSFLILAAVSILPYAILKQGIAGKDFQQLAEAKAGEFLNAQVQIGKIGVRFPNRVVLSDLKVFRGDSSRTASQFEIGQMVFRYDLLQLLLRNLKTPSAVTLRAPKMQLSSAFFENLGPAEKNAGSAGMIDLEFTGGEIRYSVPGLETEIFLADVRGRILPSSGGKIQVDLRSNLQGAAAGKLGVKGEIDPAQGQHRLELHLDSVSGSWGGPFNGKVRLEGNRLFLDRLRAKIYGYETGIQGTVHNVLQGTEGDVNLTFDLGRRAGTYPLSGKMVKKGSEILFREMKLKSGHQGEGSVNFDSGNAQFLFEKESQRISAKLNLKKPGIRFDFHLDHVPAPELDLVTAGTLELMPLELKSENRRPVKFQAEFKTDYFILEYTPFNDFKGRFQISPYGIRNFSASWGKAFDLEGEVRFAKPPQLGFSLRVNRFDLKGVQQFAARPLPRKLGGLLEGRLKIDGALNHPEISGKFTIKDGRIGKLEYDLGILQFHGFPPYVPLEDSRILKGRTTLYLNGALDFRMANMFSGIYLQTDDKLVIWKGLEMTTSEAQGDVEIESSISKLPIFNIKAGQGFSSPGTPKDNQDANDRYVAAGPKFKF